jgi:hypothetical protein
MASPGTINNTRAVEVSIHAVVPVSTGTASAAITEPPAIRSSRPVTTAFLLYCPFIISGNFKLIFLAANIYKNMVYVKKYTKKTNTTVKNITLSTIII